MKAAWLVAITLAWSSVVSAQAGSEYQRTVDTALEEYKAGHYEEARGLFQHAHELEPSARTLRGLGMVEYELRHYVRASELLEQALENARKPLTDEQRSAVDELLQRTGHLIGQYTLEVKPADVTPRVELDGTVVSIEPSLKMAVGEHRLRVSAEGYAPSELHIDAQGGERKTLSIALVPVVSAATSAPAQPEPAPLVRTRPHRKLGIVLTALGGGVAVLGGALGGVALSKANSSTYKDGPDADTAKGLALGADIAIGVGVASVVSGVVLMLVRKPQREQRVESAFPQLRVRF